MAERPLLSDLCRICNSNSPKYCCPRCSCLTCSLPCYKRHQTWSQCSGKRDPAAYVKRSQLATPSGIDHDYNFLTGIERAFDGAGRDAENRSISLDSRPTRDTNGLQRLQRRIQESRVVVRKAPKGMSRQKENQTHCSNSNGQESISWTVEWILPTGSRRLKNFVEQTRIEDAYNSLFREKAASKSKKRKRQDNVEQSQQEAGPLEDNGTEQSPPKDSSKPIADTPTTNSHQVVSLSKVDTSPTDSKPDNESPISPADTNGEANGETQPVHGDVTSHETGMNDSDTKPETPSSPTQKLEVHFYLHRPLSSSPSRVLIPLSSSTTLREALINRTVLEFPTIHVLKEPPASLPQGMQLEVDYLKEVNRMVKELDEELEPLLAQASGGAEENKRPSEVKQESFDENKVLEFLKRDIAGVQQDSIV